MYQKRIAICCIILSLTISVLPQISLAESESTFMTRSSDTLRFKAKKTEQAHFSCNDGLFQQFDPTKYKTKDDSGDDKKPSQPMPSESLSISSEFLEDQNAYKLTVTCPVDGDGVISNDQQLNQAPADGFTQSTEITLPVQKKAYETQKYIYTKLKTGDTYQYSRLELNMTVGKSKLIIDMDAITNPDGTPNLKYDKKQQQKIIAQRIKNIEQAMNDKTATEDQIKEMHELRMIQMQDHQSGHNRWDFDANRRRIMKQKRQRLLEADGRIRPKKRDVLVKGP